MTQGPESENTTIMLGLLSAVERDSELTQRSLSSELGIALGLANAYLKRCVNKGLIKVRQVPLNRYAYYLTPRGFAEKSRLTAEYLSVSFDFFRDAKHQCAALLAGCARDGRRRIALVGASELAEIMVLSAADTPVEIACVIDAKRGATSCAGRPVVGDLATALELTQATGGLDALVITDLKTPQDTFEAISEAAGKAGIGGDRVLVPALLRITEQPAVREDEEAEA
jgi:DNA-binding MarR family transcriptional regulator